MKCAIDYGGMSPKASYPRKIFEIADMAYAARQGQGTVISKKT